MGNTELEEEGAEVPGKHRMFQSFKMLQAYLLLCRLVKSSLGYF